MPFLAFPRMKSNDVVLSRLPKFFAFIAVGLFGYTGASPLLFRDVNDLNNHPEKSEIVTHLERAKSNPGSKRIRIIRVEQTTFDKLDGEVTLNFFPDKKITAVMARAADYSTAHDMHQHWIGALPDFPNGFARISIWNGDVFVEASIGTTLYSVRPITKGLFIVTEVDVRGGGQEAEPILPVRNSTGGEP